MGSDGDVVLAGLLRDAVTGSFSGLGEYPEDEVDAGAVAVVRRSLDWLSQRLDGAPPLWVAVELFAELSWWLGTCPDEEVELDVAVRVLEDGVAFTSGLSDGQRRRLVEVFGEVAAAERHEGRRRAISLIPFEIGLDEGAEPGYEAPGWVRPEDRAGRMG
ncbi:hypothetical protein [Actinoplanes couchii]|uniref:Uncharacterized protein n=1 Tax=Actinoplanes couchii TaxID=403638 RepID=A0ABQ3XLU7_9ACTN|nr:hypothetical protein [Actinoplanes couchii]MDR6319322.1 hypothetical protein [Actinoplanes couchii]GID59468.1 hypothetical protein Aco03nite_078720 [Actinoplanes couchii]